MWAAGRAAAAKAGLLGATVAFALATGDVLAQAPSMPSTLRYGSGLLDIPVSSVLPHMEIKGTVSGFWVGLDRRVEVGAFGDETGYGGPVDELYTDGALAIGLFDRIEVGTSLQSFGDASSGGNVWGLFGRARLWEPIDQGLGLAVTYDIIEKHQGTIKVKSKVGEGTEFIVRLPLCQDM